MEITYYMIIGLLIILIFLSYIAGKSMGKKYMYEMMQEIIEDERKDAIKKSRSVLTGQFGEQIAPFLPGFPVDPSECRFIGKPIDFIAFNGLNEKNVEEVVFIEVKSGKSKMNGTESSIKKAIMNKRVRFVEYRIEN